jgi:6-phosphogluconate dehydrogenase
VRATGKAFMEPQADIALIGLAVMGQNLILNMNDHGFTVVAYNRTVEKVDHFLANEAKGTKISARIPSRKWFPSSRSRAA